MKRRLPRQINLLKAFFQRKQDRSKERLARRQKTSALMVTQLTQMQRLGQVLIVGEK